MKYKKEGTSRSEAFLALDSRLLEMMSDLAQIVRYFEDEKNARLKPKDRRKEVEPRIINLLTGLSQVADTLGMSFEALKDEATAKKKRRKWNQSG